MDVKTPSKAYIQNKHFYWEPITILVSLLLHIVQSRCEADPLFIQVEDQLFKVTRRMFEESSEVFSTMFSLPQRGSSPVDGSDDEHPLVLQGIKSTDFENLLKAIMFIFFIRTAPKSENEWLSALKLATMWGMSNIRRTAINKITQLKSMSDVDQVILGKDYAVVDWVISGYQALTKRKTIISIEDASRLTLPTCLKVENQLFRVARHLFVNTSEVFSTMFSLPQDNVGVVDGSDDEHPLVLQGVESADFENILEALVAQQRTATLSQRGWISVLKLTTMWGMHDVRRLAIKELTKLRMPDVDRVVYGKEYAVVDWVISGYWDLANRKNVITTEEVSRLTLPTCRKVWQAQISISNDQPGGETSSHVLDNMFSSEVDEVYQRGQAFGDEVRSPKPSFIRHVK
ncbi:hypothetical protein EDD85DRAFT_901611 [Armillaria nabsnona]|nr:hypothetical protein EDD85DRAFT_901611 [Armillaria nabsnona]